MSRALDWPFSDRCQICVSIARHDLEGFGAALTGIDGADLVEIRLDALDDPASLTEDDLRILSKSSSVPVGFTLRPTWEGGGFDGEESEREHLLAAAARSGAAFVDVELDAEWAAELLETAPCAVIVSHHWSEPCPADLGERIEQLHRLAPAVAKLVAPADRPDQAEPLLEAGRILDERGQPAACFCMDEAGSASRLLAVGYGAALVYAARDDDEAVAPGQWPVGRLVGVLKVPEWPRGARFCGLVGDPIVHSLSPAIFNAAFRDFDTELAYVPIPGSDLESSLELATSAGFRGLSVTMPFKEEAARACTELDPLAALIGAVNTLVAEADGWHGFNTDASAVVEALSASIDLAGAEVAVVGAGGAARAAVAAIAEAGGRVTVTGRTAGRAEVVAALAAAQAAPVDRLKEARFDVVINATPVGMEGTATQGETPFPPDWLGGTEVVFDMVYRPRRTALLAAAEQRGCTTIDGLEMFVRQAAAQYRLWTGDGSDAPLAVIRATAERVLSEDSGAQTDPGGGTSGV